MSTIPRDAGIPMLTEVIEEDLVEFVGPPAPAEGVEQAPFMAEPEAPAAPPPTYATPHAAGVYAQPSAVASHYGPPAQFASSYPIPLKPAATPAPAPATPTASQADAPETPAAPAISDDEWQRMERRVRERILGQLLSRTDAMLEERIRSSVAGVLEQAVDGLAATLRASLHKALEDVVSRSVAQEISRLQSTKK